MVVIAAEATSATVVGIARVAQATVAVTVPDTGCVARATQRIISTGKALPVPIGRISWIFTL